MTTAEAALAAEVLRLRSDLAAAQRELATADATLAEAVKLARDEMRALYESKLTGIRSAIELARMVAK